MPLKRIVLIIMCTLLAIMVIMMGIVGGKVAPIFSALLGSSDGTTPTDPTTTQTDPTTESTTQPTTTLPTTQPTTTPPTTQPDHEHDFSKVKEEKKATCEAAGYTIYVCECGETKLETIDVLAHSFGVGKLVSPTCTKEGYTLRKCSVCGKEDKQDVQVKLGHDLKWVETVKVSCEGRGYEEYKCARSDCGQIVINVVEATGHKWVKGQTHAPTCTQEGYTKYTCGNENCEQKAKEDDKIDALGHSFGQWQIQTEPSVGNSGKEKRVCSTCKEEEVRECQVDILTEKGINSSQDGEETHYIINVGAKNSAGKEVVVYSYDVTDRSGLVSKDSFAYDPEAGLIITFTDKSNKTQSYVLTSDNGTFTIDKDGKQAVSGEPAASEPAGSEPTGSEPIASEPAGEGEGA